MAHRGHGIAAGLEKDGRVATCAAVRLDGDGTIVVERLVTAYDCATIVNPETVRSRRRWRENVSDDDAA